MEIAETVRIHTAEAPEPCYICLPPVFSTLFYPCCFDVRFLQSKPTYKYVSSRKPPKLPPTCQRFKFKFEIQNIEEDIFHFLPNL